MPYTTPRDWEVRSYRLNFFLFIFFLRDFIFKKTLFEKLQYLKQEQTDLSCLCLHPVLYIIFHCMYFAKFPLSVHASLCTLLCFKNNTL